MTFLRLACTLCTCHVNKAVGHYIVIPVPNWFGNFVGPIYLSDNREIYIQMDKYKLKQYLGNADDTDWDSVQDELDEMDVKEINKQIKAKNREEDK